MALVARYEARDESGEDDEADTHPHLRVTDQGLDFAAASAEDGPDDGPSEELPPPASTQGLRFSDGVPYVTLKVDGEERELPFDQVRTIAQKNLAADARLMRAGEVERTLEQRQALLLRREAELEASRSRPTPPEQGAGSGRSGANARPLAEKFVSTMFDGTREEAVEQLAVLLERTQSPSVDPGAIARTVEKEAERVALAVLTNQEKATRERALDAAVVRGMQAVKNAYPNILSDPDLMMVADRRTEVLQAEHPEWPPEQVMLEAAKQVSERFSGTSPPSPGSTSPASNLSTVRAARKSVLRPALGSRAGARLPDAQGQELDSSPRAVVDRLRQSRPGVTPTSRGTS
jgi:hypothetical protein